MSQYGSPPDPQQPEPGQGGSDPQQNPYGAPPPNPYDQPQSPYGQPDPYGAPPPNQYGQPPNPYGQPAPYGQQPPGAPANPYAGTPAPGRPTFGFGGYAAWISRVGAYLIDGVLGAIAGLPVWIAYAIIIAHTSTTTDSNGVTTTTTSDVGAAPVVLLLLGGLTSLAFFVWNVCIRQGRTGATVGKSVLAIRLVNSDLQPIGGGWAFLRYILHIVDALPCYLGYLWPLWDSRNQTFADKIMNTFVINATEPQQPPW